MVADDHDKTRAAIASLLAFDFDVVSSVADGQAAVEAVRALIPIWWSLTSRCPASTGSRLPPSSGTCPTRPGSSMPPRTRSVNRQRRGRAGRLGRGAEAEMLTELVPAVRRALLFHAVCFYEDSPSLARTVARFIGEGLAARQAAVIVATASHGASIRDQLTTMGVDSQERIDQGELLMFDADEVLNRFMVGNLPDAQRFEDTIDPIVDKAAAAGSVWCGSTARWWTCCGAAAGRCGAVARDLWHQLIAGRKCSLLCGYSSSVCPERGVQHHL